MLRHNAKLDYEDLREAAHTALSQSNFTQEEMAQRLDRSRGLVARAVNHVGSRYERTQIRILELLTDYRFRKEETVHFRPIRKDRVQDDD